MPANSLQSQLAVIPVNANDETTAVALSQRLKLRLLKAGSDPALCDDIRASLLVQGLSLSVQLTGKGAPGPVRVEFGSSAMRHRRRGGNNELLGKAVGLGKKSPLRILDATAGLGRDSFVLADLGCELILCEREPVVLELLAAGIYEAEAAADGWLDSVMDRMRLCPGDARTLPLAQLKDIDVIYLDPMFGPRSKSAAVKKEMALFQWLLEDSALRSDEDELFSWALRQDVARVVVKRALRAPALGGQPPSHCIEGKAVRYDVYVRHKLI